MKCLRKQEFLCEHAEGNLTTSKKCSRLVFYYIFKCPVHPIQFNKNSNYIIYNLYIPKVVADWSMRWSRDTLLIKLRLYLITTVLSLSGCWRCRPKKLCQLHLIDFRIVQKSVWEIRSPSFCSLLQVIFIEGEGDGIESRLPFRMSSTLIKPCGGLFFWNITRDLDWLIWSRLAV